MAGSERLNAINNLIGSNLNYEQTPSFETALSYRDEPKKLDTISNKVKYNSNIKVERAKQKIEKSIMNPLINFLKNIGRVGILVVVGISIFLLFKFLNESKKFQKNFLKG